MTAIASKARVGAGVHREQNGAGYLFIAPLLLIFSVFLFYSFFFLLRYSFLHSAIASPDVTPAGLSNYRVILSDRQFWLALKNTFLVSAADIVAGLTLGFLLSVFLSFRFRGRKFFHSLFFVPSMLPVAFIASVFSNMLEYREGTLNQVFRLLGLGGLAQRWLSIPSLAVGSVMSVSVYLVGIAIMYYMADMATINTSIFEAAIIDGAGMGKMITRILFPMLKGTHQTIALSMLLGGFRQMERVYLMTDGGPGGATEIFGTYIYSMFRSPGSDYGIVSAASVLILIIAFLIAFLQLRMYRKTED